MDIVKALGEALAPVTAYFRASDPEAAARNTIAATVIGNIPFYPLYLAAIVGGRAWPSLLSFLSLPLFLLVPPAGRRSARAGRAALLGAGLVDTALCARGLGAASGVELYYAPIALLPIALYREETLLARGLMVVAVAAVCFLGRLVGGAMETYDASEMHSMTILHAVSVAALSVLILILRWRMGPR